MPTWTALTTLPDSDKAEALGAALEALEPEPTGVGIFELEDGSGLWEVGGYFSVAPDVIALSILAAVHGARPFAVSDLPETDWVAHVRRELHPVEAGRFFVYGSHDAAALPADRIGLLIEAAMAFGTGHHGTTKGCLDAFDMLLTTMLCRATLPTSVAARLFWRLRRPRRRMRRLSPLTLIRRPLRWHAPMLPPMAWAGGSPVWRRRGSRIPSWPEMRRSIWFSPISSRGR